MVYEEVPEFAVAEPPWDWDYLDKWNAALQLFPAEKRADSDSEETDLIDAGSSCPSDAVDQGGDSMMDDNNAARHHKWHEEMQSLSKSFRTARLIFWKEVRGEARLCSHSTHCLNVS